jgi:hypothetical protein
LARSSFANSRNSIIIGSDRARIALLIGPHIVRRSAVLRSRSATIQSWSRLRRTHAGRRPADPAPMDERPASRFLRISSRRSSMMDGCGCRATTARCGVGAREEMY